MNLLESLYRLLTNDEQVRLLDPVAQASESTAAAAAITRNIFVPTDRRAWLLNHVSLFADPGAAQNVTSMFVQIVGTTGIALVDLIREQEPLGANVTRFASWQGELVVTSGVLITGVVNFNAAVAANFARLTIGGMQIPLGNIERI